MVFPYITHSSAAMATSSKFLHCRNPLLVSVLSIIIVYLLIKRWAKPKSSIRYPPGPLALPIIGHLYLLSSSLPKSFQALARLYGPLMRIHIAQSIFIVVSDAVVAKEVLKVHDAEFASRFEFGPAQYNIYKDAGFITGPYGSYWRFMKKLCMTRLFTGRQLDRFNHIREEEMVKLLKSLVKKSREGKWCDLSGELANLTNNLIFRMTMNKRFSKDNSEGNEMWKLVTEIMGLAAKLGVNEVHGLLKKFDLFGNGKKLREGLERYDKLVEQIIKDYEENYGVDDGSGNEDLMDILLGIYRDKNAGLKITREQIKYFIFELFTASIDTSSAAIQWGMAELMNHPQVFKRLREEIDSVVNTKRVVKESDVPNLPYLQAIAKETLRLHSPVPIFHRECIKDCNINGFDLQVKDRVLINAYAIMRHPEAWSDPDTYLPERFLENSGGNRDQDFWFLPFGSGRRVCAGSLHAYLVMHGTIGSLVQCFDWKTKDGAKVDITVGSGFSVLLVKSLRNSKSKGKYPPSAPALPIIGHIHLLKSGLPTSFATLARKYGPLMQIRLGAAKFVVVSDAKSAQEILRTFDTDFASKFQPGPTNYHIYEDSSFANAPYGAYWKFMKKLFMTKLLTGSQLQRFTNIGEQETIKLIKSLLNRSKAGEPCDLTAELTEVTHSTIYKMAMGRRYSNNPSQAAEIRKIITVTLKYAAKFHLAEVFGPLQKFDLFGKGKRLNLTLKGYDQLIEQIMKDYQDNDLKYNCENDDEKDVMDILLETYKDADAEVKLTRDQIKNFFMELFMAGVDTTAAVIRWAMEELINHPNIFKILREEIDSIVGNNRLIKESDVPKLPYLQAVAKEILRLHPPSPFLRRLSNKDSKINGFDIQKGTRVFINVYMLMRDPNCYKEPEKFMPERFLGNCTEMKGRDFHYLPFGRGRRGCPGASLAKSLLHATIGALVQCFDWKVKDGEKADTEATGTGYSGAFASPLPCYPITRFDPFQE